MVNKNKFRRNKWPFTYRL